MNNRSRVVETALEEARCVREAVEDLARVQTQALLQSLGICVPDLTSDSESDSDCTCDEPQDFSESESPLNYTTVDTQDDDIHASYTDCLGALEDLPLVDIGTSSDRLELLRYCDCSRIKAMY